MLGSLSLLQDTALDDDQRRFVETSRRSADWLLSIINDIPDFSKMEAGRLELCQEAFDPATLVEGVVTLLLPRAREKGLALETRLAPDLPRALRGDPTRLRQVLLNLIVNAIKFTDSGFVRVEVESREGANGAVPLRFAVSDSGIGIAEEARPLLFREFTRWIPRRRAASAATGSASPSRRTAAADHRGR